MQSKVATVKEYIDNLPADRKEAIVTVRKAILENLPKGYREAMNWGMICYEIPLEVFPDTYNKKPFMYIAIANQKKHMAVYLNGLYLVEGAEAKFRTDYEATGKKLDMGVGCVRFKTLDDLPLDIVGRYAALLTPDALISAARQAKKK